MGNFSNANSVINSWNKKKAILNNIIKKEVETAGRNAESKAKTNAPVDTGKHRQSIAYESANQGYTARISANEPYSPLIEFGTGTDVDIPNGFESLAVQFKGKGERQVNIPARPHIIPAAIEEANNLRNRLKRLLNAE